MKDTVCLDCRAILDGCWRWCPECGSLELSPPQGFPAARWHDDEYAVEWKLDCDDSGRFDRDRRVGSHS